MALLKIEEPKKNLEEKSQESEIMVGIDFGTTNSLIGMVVNDKVHFFSDKNSQELHKSIVAFDENGRVSKTCNEADSGDFATKISSIKRLMGKGFGDVENSLEEYDFAIEKTGENEIQIAIGEQKYRVEKIASEILKYLRNLAVQTVGADFAKKVKAVITVPAYFDEAAKNATKLAAKLAQIETVRLVNEPTAAALAYGLDSSKEGIYTVFDLGGGTFDVSILKMQKGVFRVLGVAGDNALGGDDIDTALAAAIFGDDFKADLEGNFGAKSTSNSKTLEENSKNDLSKNSSTKKLDLKKIAKKIKEDFTTQESVELNKYNGLENIDKKITRHQFEEIIEPIITKTMNLTTGLIDELSLEIGDEKNEIQGVILVGGSSRIPLISQKLRDIFGAAKIYTDLDCDRVVADGAVLQAHSLATHGDNLLLDVTPLSLGVEMMGGIVDKIIARNTTIPIAMAKEFTTYADDQTGLKLHIVQGEREFAKDCRSLANFEIKNIPAMRAGLARVLVTFKVDADGLLTVTALEKTTMQQQEIIVKPSFGIDENSVKNMLLDSMQNAKSDIALRLEAEAVREAKQNLDFLWRDLKEHGDLIDENEKNKITKAGQNLAKLIEEKAAKSQIVAAQKSLEDASENFILQKVNKTLEFYVEKKIDDV